MVHSSPRHYLYKQRVLGRQGHLSNEQCAELLAQVWHPGLKHVHLAHLSSECNSEERALEIVNEKFTSLGAEVKVSIAFQDKVSVQVEFAETVLDNSTCLKTGDS